MNNPKLFINSYSDINKGNSKSIYMTNKFLINIDGLEIGKTYTFEIKSKELIKGKLIKINNNNFVLLKDNVSVSLNKNNVNKVYNY